MYIISTCLYRYSIGKNEASTQEGSDYTKHQEEEKDSCSREYELKKRQCCTSSFDNLAQFTIFKLKQITGAEVNYCPKGY